MCRDVKNRFHRQKPTGVARRSLGESLVNDRGGVGMFAGKCQCDRMSDRAIDGCESRD
jgi:hypothetical protein